MGRILILEGNEAQIRIDVLIEANEFKKKRLYQSLSAIQAESSENNRVIRAIVDQIIFLKKSEATVSLEEYAYLIVQLNQLVEVKRLSAKKVKDITSEIKQIDKESNKLLKQREEKTTKILEFPEK